MRFLMYVLIAAVALVAGYLCGYVDGWDSGLRAAAAIFAPAVAL